MAPKKKKGDGGASKAAAKQRDKIVEDKTFGLKNKKKSQKVQKYVQHVNANVRGTNESMEEDKRRQKKLAKERAEKERKEIGDIFRPVVVKPSRVDTTAGGDPKATLCQYFKAGFCARGKNCKFSHDLSLEGKAAKINLYNDPRNNPENTDGMEGWGQKDLEGAVNAAEEKRKNAGKLPPTTIICKYFLQAVEDGKYGWFWKCPNGGEGCHYRHCLPPGYVLRDKNAKTDDNDNRVPLEEELEIARTQLETRTPVTPELFAEWKKKKAEEKKRLALERKKELENSVKKKGSAKLMNGRDLFTYKPVVFQDDLDANDDDIMQMKRDTEANQQQGQQEQQEEDVEVDAGLFGADDDLLGIDDDIDEEELFAVVDHNIEQQQQQHDNNNNEFPKYSDDELKALSKKDLVELLKLHGDELFTMKHQLGGQVKNVVKKKKVEDLHDAYNELLQQQHD